MAYSAGFTAVTGATYTASQYNTYVRDNLAAIWVYTTQGDIAYANSSTTAGRLAIGTPGQTLTVNGAGTLPIWADGVPGIFAANGDLAVGSAANAVARLAVAATFGKVLMSDPNATRDLDWYSYMEIAYGQYLPSEFSTTSTSFVDSGASLSLTLTRTSTVIMIASGVIRADYTGEEAVGRLVINGTASGNSFFKECSNNLYDYSHDSFCSVFMTTSVPAGARILKVQLKTSSALAMARIREINILGIAIPTA